jgi:hypothetical protein
LSPPQAGAGSAARPVPRLRFAPACDSAVFPTYWTQRTSGLDTSGLADDACGSKPTKVHQMTERSPIVVLILFCVTFGIYPIYWFIKTREEMVNLGADIPNWILLFVPILNLLWIYKYCQGVEKVTKGEQAAMMTLIFFLILGPIGAFIVQGKFNEIGGGAKSSV